MTKRTLVAKDPRATAVRFAEDSFTVELEDGRELCVPLEWFVRLRDAAPEQLDRYAIGGGGVSIHWPELDEDVSVAWLLTGES
jgi:hypothetical protein